MAEGDITKVYENDKIEVVMTWSIQIRKATIIKEEQADGSKLELTRKFHRHVLMPFDSNSSISLKNCSGFRTHPGPIIDLMP